MNKLVLSIMLLLITLTFISCSEKDTNMSAFGDNDTNIADMTFNEVISAVRARDNSKIVDMFSCAIKSANNLSDAACRFVEFIHGDILSLSSASETGVGADYKKENGKTRKEIQSTFCINTTENTYYIAIKECIKDEFDSNNIGVLSIYIIEANNWTEDYVYRGDGKWIHGINIVDPSEAD